MCELIGGATYKELAVRSLKVTLELSELLNGRSDELRMVALGQLAPMTVGLRSDDPKQSTFVQLIRAR